MRKLRAFVAFTALATLAPDGVVAQTNCGGIEVESFSSTQIGATLVYTAKFDCGLHNTGDLAPGNSLPAFTSSTQTAARFP
jgi:hypothetical protein